MTDPLAGGVRSPGERFLGIDAGAETLKVVELVREDGCLRWARRHLAEHGKKPVPRLLELLASWGWDTVSGAAVTGRLARQANLPRIPLKQAQARGCRFLLPDGDATVVSIGSRGFSVLDLRPNGLEVFRENSKCSQGTGNFLRQLVERFGLTLAEADLLCVAVARPAALSGRCPVILKTDMTHLANQGEDRARILAGLFDAVCENVLALVRPDAGPVPVLLAGGVCQGRRVRAVCEARLAAVGRPLAPLAPEDLRFLEALGCAVLAAESKTQLPPLSDLLAPELPLALEKLPSLAAALSHVRRLAPPPAPPDTGRDRELALGLDIGSTGSKVVALDLQSREVVWDAYLQTRGNPVGAAQALVQRFQQSPASRFPVRGVGVTGSGREVVGSLLTSCYGRDAVFVLNEIAAHAAGATHYEPTVDTIFEIGGQDAKYIRLAGGRVVDCAMNEACSAGTGSFIEEQGRRFAGIRDVAHLGEVALNAPHGVSLGQHCSVFMAEVIDGAVAAAVEPPAIIAGLYDSVVQNYLHRVKGSRSVGQVIFCQGMPFASDALAAAVARQTSTQVVIPPNPGTVGALGIALLAAGELPWRTQPVLALDRFLEAAVESRQTFVCPSTRGCGGSGNRCRIDLLRTRVDGCVRNFTWGGGCALHDQATRRVKLPDLTPDPFREREALLRAIVEPLTRPRGRPRVAVTDEFVLKGLLPFFATFLHELGCDLTLVSDGSQATLKRGIQEAGVPFCAPMQLYCGCVSRLAETEADLVFLPFLRGIPRVNGEPHAATCPVVQASADLCRWRLRSPRPKVLSPVINIGRGNLDSGEFLDACRALARELDGVNGDWRRAHAVARQAQQQFEAGCRDLGHRALEFCRRHSLTPVVVLGRPYTIYNPVLNSNVPAILREQGAVGIPVDCYPVADDGPVFHHIYWGHAQRILRAAHQVRRSPGVYAVYCSNYSCGPDSFNLHFFSHVMDGKPFAVIETDGHSGDAGTRTRIEAFLHCVAQDQLRAGPPRPPHDFARAGAETVTFARARQQHAPILIPWMGPSSNVVAACFRGLGFAAEALPMPDHETIRLGRRLTSGKECLPMCLTLGSLIQRVRNAPTGQPFVLLLPKTYGPCRFGMYRLLDEIALERLGWKDRVQILSPADTDYFEGQPPGFVVLVYAGLVASDLLFEAYLETRPGESSPGAAARIYQQRHAQLLTLLEQQAGHGLSLATALGEAATRRLFGIRTLLADAAAEFAASHVAVVRPTVAVVGEVYVRCDPFANDFVVEKLHAHGLRVRFAPLGEWLDYCRHLHQRRPGNWDIPGRLNQRLQVAVGRTLRAPVARRLGWPPPVPIEEMLAAARTYLRDDLWGEAVLTVGNPVQAWRQGDIDAVVSVGPLECMPNKIAEAHLLHVTEHEGLPALTLSLNGDPLEPDALDNFAFEVHARFRRRQGEFARETRPRLPIAAASIRSGSRAATRRW